MKRLICIMAIIASPSYAVSVGKSMSRTPDIQLESTKSLVDIERCIVLADMLVTPSVYRPVETPNEGIIFYYRSLSSPSVVRLTQNLEKTVVTAWIGGKSEGRTIVDCTA